MMTHGRQLTSGCFNWPGDRVEHLGKLIWGQEDRMLNAVNVAQGADRKGGDPIGFLLRRLHPEIARRVRRIAGGWQPAQPLHRRELVRCQLKVLAEHGIAGRLTTHLVARWTAEPDKWGRVATGRLRADGQIAGVVHNRDDLTQPFRELRPGLGDTAIDVEVVDFGQSVTPSPPASYRRPFSWSGRRRPARARAGQALRPTTGWFGLARPGRSQWGCPDLPASRPSPRWPGFPSPTARTGNRRHRRLRNRTR